MWSFLCLVFVIFRVGSADLDSACVHQLTTPIGLSEGPHWDSRKNVLFFVNIPDGEVYAYHYNSKILNKIILSGTASPVVPSRNDPNLLMVGINRSVVAVEWDGKNNLGGQQVLTTLSQQFPESRLNDGKADKQGRLWWGTMGSEGQGLLYTITKKNLNNPNIAVQSVSTSNGLAWNKANNKLYYIDTPTLKVVSFDYDDENGTISSTNKTVFDLRSTNNVTGYPDGMTIDTEDNLYIALYGGGSVIKVNPATGKLLKVIAIPARDISSVTWGGPNLDILFVTTSDISLSPSEKIQYPAAGSVFAVTGLNARGFEAYTADIF
ncbi:regucalcin-like isoform X3 [Diabrotica undecimpunctata]|uniref:regucalcin-like isoform X3 n=1 Tax=Diabrotica undecimpunctata TaxID=50387 RepID=UPI003B63FE52